MRPPASSSDLDHDAKVADGLIRRPLCGVNAHASGSIADLGFPTISDSAKLREIVPLGDVAHAGPFRVRGSR
jgi:hypothetical protein